jgi:hypothetical protein
MDSGAFGYLTPTNLREAVRSYPGIRPDIQFWDDEFNALPDLPRGNDESVQAKYVPRGMLYNWANGVPTYIWELINDTSTSEGDNFGIIHGMMYKPADFTPRPAYFAVQNLNALFSDTHRDPTIDVSSPEFAAISQAAAAPVLAYGFRSHNGKSIIGFWLAAQSWPHNAFVPRYVTLMVKNTGIKNPLLANVYTGEVKPQEWKAGTQDTLEKVPLLDAVQAIMDQSYFDWPVLPEAPSSLQASVSNGVVDLSWKLHGGDRTAVVVERRLGSSGAWSGIAKLTASATDYADSHPPEAPGLSYRVRAVNDAGQSAYSNVVRPGLHDVHGEPRH